MYVQCTLPPTSSGLGVIILAGGRDSPELARLPSGC